MSGNGSVLGSGPLKRPVYPVMFVGEAPGAEDVRSGRLFSGEVGKEIVHPLLHHFNLIRSKVWFHSAMVCRPSDNRMNTSAARKALKLCSFKHLIPFIQKHQPSVIIAFGVVVTNLLTGRSNTMREVRGVPERVLIGGCETIIIPTYHPASALHYRNPHNITPIYADVARALDICDRGFKPVKEKYHVLDTLPKVIKFFTWLDEHPSARKMMSFDVESQVADPPNVNVFRDKVLGISFSWAEGRAAYIPIRYRPDFTYAIDLFWGDDHDTVVGLIAGVLIDGTIKKGGQNKKYDNKQLLLDLEIDTKGVVFDTMMASHTLDENQLSHSLAEQRRLFVPEKHKWKDAAEYDDMAAMPLEDIAYYCNSDADVERRLCLIHNRRLKRYPKLHKMFRGYVMPLQRALQAMELRGAPIDERALKTLSVDLAKEQRRLEIETRQKFGRSVKVDSVQEVLAALYDSGVDLLLLEEKDFDGERVVDSKGQVKYKTDRTHLEVIAKTSDLAQLILDTRAVTKLKSTYVDPIGSRVRDGWIHPSILMHSVVTGRPSSREPNLLNIPRGGKDSSNARHVWGKRVKGLYRAPNGCYVLQADYSQMEIRSFAYFAGDMELVHACTLGDVHLSTACMAWNLNFDESFKLYKAGDAKIAEKRQVAKSAAFLVFYGGSAEAASVLLGVPLDVVKECIGAYFNAFKDANKWIKETHRLVDRKKVVTDAFGWMRRIPYAGQKGRVGEAHRQAVNSIIQGFSARVCLMALIRLEKRFVKEGLSARTNLSVYDSIIPMTVPKDELEDTAYVMQDEMVKKPVPDFNVPLRVDFEYGDRWSELEELNLAG